MLARIYWDYEKAADRIVADRSLAQLGYRMPGKMSAGKVTLRRDQIFDVMNSDHFLV